jgi:hypothetical protein
MRNVDESNIRKIVWYYGLTNNNAYYVHNDFRNECYDNNDNE